MRNTEIVAAAREWKGTPYAHQGRLKGVAVDCVGLILGVGQELKILEIDPQEWKRHAGYSRTPNPRLMGEGMERFLRRLDCPADKPAPDGSIGWFQWEEGLPMHLAIMATFEGRRTMIHAYSHAGRCVEHGFVSEWPGRVVSWWSFPGALASGAAHDDQHPGHSD